MKWREAVTCSLLWIRLTGFSTVLLPAWRCCTEECWVPYNKSCESDICFWYIVVLHHRVQVAYLSKVTFLIRQGTRTSSFCFVPWISQYYNKLPPNTVKPAMDYPTQDSCSQGKRLICLKSWNSACWNTCINLYLCINIFVGNIKVESEKSAQASRVWSA